MQILGSLSADLLVWPLLDRSLTVRYRSSVICIADVGQGSQIARRRRTMEFAKRK